MKTPIKLLFYFYINFLDSLNEYPSVELSYSSFTSYLYEVGFHDA